MSIDWRYKEQGTRIEKKSSRSNMIFLEGLLQQEWMMPRARHCVSRRKSPSEILRSEPEVALHQNSHPSIKYSRKELHTKLIDPKSNLQSRRCYFAYPPPKHESRHLLHPATTPKLCQHVFSPSSQRLLRIGCKKFHLSGFVSTGYPASMRHEYRTPC